ETADGLGGVGRPLARPESAQVDVQLAVREPGRGLLSPAHRQRGLPDPGRPADYRDRHRAVVTPGLIEPGVQRGQLGLPAGEVPDPAGSWAGVSPGAALPAGLDVPSRSPTERLIATSSSPAAPSSPSASVSSRTVRG